MWRCRRAIPHYIHAMYVLHYAPDNASLILRLALEEIGAPYRTVLVDRSRAEQSSPKFLALNPNGLIPALETPDGVMFETGACLLWLADRHARLAPPADSPARAQFLTWLTFCANTLHPHLRILFYTHLYAETPDAQAALQSHVQTILRRSLKTLNDHRTPPDNPEVTDLYAAACLRWCAIYGPAPRDWFQLSDYPALMARAQLIEARASCHAVADAEGLGSRPFTQPHRPTPPEGSAL